MVDDGDGDWRLAVVVHSAEAMPATAAGAPAHEAGARITQATLTRDAQRRLLSFTTPSAVAMALDVAMKAVDRERELRAGIGFDDDVVTPWGSGKSVRAEGELFDYFEQCMIVTAFSYQALETYCNLTISRKLDGVFPFERGTGDKKEVKEMTADDLERWASTEDKLDQVLPRLLEMTSPKGKAAWANFVVLQRARNATIHLKAQDQNPRIKGAEDLDRPSLFYRFLHDDVSALPKAAVSMIHYFARFPEVPRWLQYPMKVYGVGEQLRPAAISVPAVRVDGSGGSTVTDDQPREDPASKDVEAAKAAFKASGMSFADLIRLAEREDGQAGGRRAASRTRFRQFSAADATGRDEIIQQANAAMTEIEAAGGEYVDSHLTTAKGSGPTVVYTLVLVYREADHEAADSDGENETPQGGIW